MLIRVLLLVAMLGLQNPPHGNPPPLPTGQVIETVTCADYPGQTYALYLPSNYTPAKHWPVIYAFDPDARGALPVKLFSHAAEQYGYIIVGSNNSRNFSLEDTSRSATAMWTDTHARLSLDDRQIYTTGFSGGARMAGLIALRCPQCKVVGVIAQGAAYPETGQSRAKDNLLYFFSVGDEDFNWPEVILAARQREAAGEAYRLRIFPGPHRWAPAEIIEDAVEWIHLKAMQSGVQPPDRAFIESRFRSTQADAAQAEQGDDYLAQLAAYRSLVSDFEDLMDVSAYAPKLNALKKSDGLKKALKQQDDAITQQESLVQQLSPMFDTMATGSVDQKVKSRAALVDCMTALRSQVRNSRSDLVRVRADNDLWALGIERGQSALANKHYDEAATFFELMSEVRPDEPWPFLLMAETRVAAGDNKKAIKAIREAVKRGLTDPSILEKDRDLEPLRSQREFQTILNQLRTKSH